MRPLIGVTTDREHARWGDWNAEVDLLPTNYADTIADAGGCPLLVPLRAGFEVELLARLDGLVLSGGPDIGAERYGERYHAMMCEVRPERDELELALLDAFLAARRPILAICRGAQLLNVLRGGSLLQHLPDNLDGVNHRGERNASIRHVVTLTPGGRVAMALGAEVHASCNHHQAINRLGSGVRAVGHAADGVIEAVELDDHPFAVGIQWHPEMSSDARLFRALVVSTSVRGTQRRYQPI